MVTRLCDFSWDLDCAAFFLKRPLSALRKFVYAMTIDPIIIAALTTTKAV